MDRALVAAEPIVEHLDGLEDAQTARAIEWCLRRLGWCGVRRRTLLFDVSPHQIHIERFRLSDDVLEAGLIEVSRSLEQQDSVSVQH